MSLKSRHELCSTVASRYQKSSRSAKCSILNEFIESTGYGRKYAIFLLGRYPEGAAGGALLPKPPRTRRRKYGPDVELALVHIWAMSACLCAKRLVPFLPTFIDALERHAELTLCPGVRIKLLSMSISTAERLLRSSRRKLERGLTTTSPSLLLRHMIPIRTFEDWNDSKPGLMEIDLVAHCGGSAAGDYLYTLTMTDICTGWTECIAITNRSQIAVKNAIDMVRLRLPFKLLGIDSDNGSEFINHHLKQYCDDHNITFTRCRPYKKNDQCHVEQKNGAVVRPLVGYARYEGAAAAEHLNKLYAVHRLALNYFEPSMKLTGKTRVGARVKKIYDQAKTPHDRLLESGLMQGTTRAKREVFFRKLNPAKLRRDIHELEMGLRRHTVGQPMQRPEDSLATVAAAPPEGGIHGTNA